MMSDIRLRAAILAMLTMAFGSGCDEQEGSPSSRVSNPRILAVQAEPPVVNVGGDSALVPLLAGVDAATAVTWSLRACNPWRVVTDPTSDCGPNDSLPLERDSFAMGEGGWLRTAELLQAFPPPDWAQTALGSSLGVTAKGMDEPPACGETYDFIDAVVVLEAVIAGGTRLTATKRVRVTTEPVARMNPVVQDVSLDDRPAPVPVAPDTAYTLVAAPRQDSLDLICGPDGVGVLESVRVYVYASAGELDDPYIDVTYTAEGQEMADMTMWTSPPAGDAHLWLVAIDGDGGAGWRQIDLSVDP